MAPILAMVMLLPTSQPRALQTLLLSQQRQQAKDNGHTGIELHLHQGVRHRIGNVLKVHRFTLDEHANGDDGVKGRRGDRGGFGRGLLRQVARRRGQEVGCGDVASRRARGGLHVGCSVYTVDYKQQSVSGLGLEEAKVYVCMYCMYD
jgi:hypothetical protein